MMIKTDEAVILNRKQITKKISKFWDQISDGWEQIWGQHIHHGYYEGDEIISHQEAQEKLLVKIVNLLDLSQGIKILDVGCGLGGSSIYLAEKYHATVTGITLSPRQVKIAQMHAKNKNISNITFNVEDALALSSVPDNSIDLVWSLESCEQFYDKSLFFNQAFRVLKPGGRIMLATWCSSSPSYEGQSAKDYKKLCDAFDLPYMPTMDYYHTQLTAKNFLLTTVLDWSQQVKKSWEIGLSLVNTYSFFRLFMLGGLRGLRFVKQLKLMRNAFRHEKIKYGVFIAAKN